MRGGPGGIRDGVRRSMQPAGLPEVRAATVTRLPVGAASDERRRAVGRREMHKEVCVRGVLARVSSVACGLAIILSAVGASSAQAVNSSLYSGLGPRPGPEILYSEPAIAPQLENTGPWRAPPILVSGAEA